MAAVIISTRTVDSHPKPTNPILTLGTPLHIASTQSDQSHSTILPITAPFSTATVRPFPASLTPSLIHRYCQTSELSEVGRKDMIY